MGIEFRHHPGLIAYLTIGDPDLVTSKKNCACGDRRRRGRDRTRRAI